MNTKHKKMKLKTMISFAAIITAALFTSSCKDDDNDTGTHLNPIVTSTAPLGNETDVARNLVISITFSEAMNASTINATTVLFRQGTTIIPGTVEYSGLVATFAPLGTLAAATQYTATVTTEAKSAQGKPLVSNHTWSFTTAGSTANLTGVSLGSAGNYVILAKSAINNSPISAITGDIGLSPAATSYIAGFSLTNATGFATSAQVTGSIFAADMADPTPANLTTAVDNMITAYNDAAGRTSADFLELGTGIIGGLTLTPGLYKWTNSVTIPTNVTISGTATDVWIFQIAGNLEMSSAVNIILSGGARTGNIFWQVAGQATLGTTSHFEGILLSMTGITLQTGATMNGRALAQTAVVLNGNTVVQPQ
jgi:hypothetical protein